MCTTTKETTRRGSLNNSASAALSFIAVHLWRYFVISLAKVWNKVNSLRFLIFVPTGWRFDEKQLKYETMILQIKGEAG